MRVIDPIHRLDKTIRHTLKQTDINLQLKKSFKDIKDIHYERKKEKLVIRTESTRYTF